MTPPVIYTSFIIHVILCQMQTVYIPPEQCTAGITHIRLWQLNAVNMIPPASSTEGIIHVSLCQLETVYMIPPVLSPAGIIHIRLC